MPNFIDNFNKRADICEGASGCHLSDIVFRLIDTITNSQFFVNKSELFVSLKIT